jgi:eukaryotic-like serine/threonine-protein kinase
VTPASEERAMSGLAPTVAGGNVPTLRNLPATRSRHKPRRSSVPMPSPVTAPPTARSALLVAVRAAGVLAPAQFARAEALAPNGTAADFAQSLVAHGLLTRFQADRLLAGRTDGFALDQYVLLDQVGRGPRSRVYKAKHRTMKRPVALQVLAAELTRTPAQRAALLKAVRSAAGLAHPNVVTAYDANELHDRFYLVLEFVDGPDLGALVAQRGPLPVDEACELVRQAASGLQHAHEKGIVHGDIKPNNIMVARPTPGAALAVKLADFGVPKGPASANGFAAPEQLDPAARRFDHRADLYSLGAVLFFLLTGRAPTRGADLARLRPDVPATVAAIVQRLLAPLPAARFQSAAELLAELDAACVPVAIPVESISFDLPVYVQNDSDVFSGRYPVPAEEASPWEQLTTASAGDTLPHDLERTPVPHAPKPARRKDVSPVTMVTLFVGALLLCLMGIGGVVGLLAK